MATTFYLRDAASDLGGAGQKALDTARGAASTTAVTTTVASGTNIQVTKSGVALTWFTGKLAAVTVTGSVTVNIRGYESSSSANSKAGITVEYTDAAGNVLGTIVANTGVPTTSSEYGTSDGAKNAAFTPTSAPIPEGGRIKVTLFVKNQGTMGGGYTVTNSYDGAVGGAAGDTYVTFTETITAHQTTQALAGSAACASSATADLGLVTTARIRPVGTEVASTAATITLSPAAGTNSYLLFVTAWSAAAARYATGVTGGNCTWTQLGTAFFNTVNNKPTPAGLTAWLGVATGTGSQAATVTFDSTPSAIRSVAQQFSSDAPLALDGAPAGVDSAGTNQMPSRTPLVAGELYIGYDFEVASATAGATPGYTYQVDANGNGLVYNSNCGAGAQAPTWGSSTMGAGLAVMLSAALLPLSGAAASASQAAGDLTVSAAGTVWEATGTAACASSASGALAATLALTGQAAGVSAASGTLASTLALSGQAAKVSSASGALTSALAAAGTAASASSAAGALTGVPAATRWVGFHPAQINVLQAGMIGRYLTSAQGAGLPYQDFPGGGSPQTQQVLPCRLEPFTDYLQEFPWPPVIGFLQAPWLAGPAQTGLTGVIAALYYGSGAGLPDTYGGQPGNERCLTQPGTLTSLPVPAGTWPGAPLAADGSAAIPAIPMIGWHLGNTPLADIAAGLHDADTIIPAALACKNWPASTPGNPGWPGQPGGEVWIRLMHEFNGTWADYCPGSSSQPSNTTTADFVNAWRHIVEVFAAQGATNARWVWAPNIASSGAGTPNHTGFAQTSGTTALMYPGDRYVDVIGIDGYNKQYPNWKTFSTVFQNTYNWITAGDAYTGGPICASKPMVITETSSAEAESFTNPPQTKADYINDIATVVPASMPLVKGVVIWHEATNNDGLEWFATSTPESAAAWSALTHSWTARPAPVPGVTASLLALQGSASCASAASGALTGQAAGGTLRVNTLAITAKGTTASPLSAAVPAGTGTHAGDLLVALGGSNGTHVLNGMAVQDSVNLQAWTSLGECQQSASAGRYQQAFAYVTPVDIPDGSTITVTPYASATSTGLVVDVFRNATATVSRAIVSAYDSGNDTVAAAPALASAPPAGDLVLELVGGNAQGLAAPAPFTLGSENSETTTAPILAIGYVLAADGAQAYGQDWTASVATTSGGQTVSFAKSGGPLPLQGSASSPSSGSGALAGLLGLGGSASSGSGGAGLLGLVMPIQGTAVSLTSGQGALALALASMAASATSASAAGGALRQTMAAAAAAAAVSHASGDLAVQAGGYYTIAGSAACVSASAAALAQSLGVSASAAGAPLASGALRQTMAVAAVAATVSLAAGALRQTGSAAGLSAAASLAAGALGIRWQALAACATASTAAGSLTVVGPAVFGLATSSGGPKSRAIVSGGILNHATTAGGGA